MVMNMTLAGIPVDTRIVVPFLVISVLNLAAAVLLLKNIKV
jgi:hypothetical protein